MASLVPTQRIRKPTHGSSFVGREAEIHRVTQMISRARLVTILGTGGVGKTRLMLEAVGRLGNYFADGTRFFDVAGTTDPELMRFSFAATLGVPDRRGTVSLAAICEALSDKKMLLLIDNCEHGLETCAEFVEELLARTESARVLCTSRERLNVPGEEVLTLQTLEVPDLDSPVAVVDLLRYDAIRLFTERAQAVAPGFEVTDVNGRDVADLCRRLDGLPLAIELAAARMNALTVDQLLERLDTRFDILTNGRRTALPHQRTLLALIDWSYQLCSPDERLLWARAAVFSGGFHLAAVEAICSDQRLPARAVAGLVADLVDKSVLVRDDSDRYVLLESIRTYGATLPIEGREALALKHAEYYGRLVDSAREDWITRAGTAWQARLRSELPNLRVALEYCCGTPGQARAGLEMASGLWLFWRAAGLVGEGRAWLDRLLHRDSQPSLIRTTALCHAAWLALNQNDSAAVSSLLAELRAVPDELLDDTADAFIGLLSGDVALIAGDFAGAEPLLRAALEQFRSQQDEVGARMCLIRLALTLSSRGNFDGALEQVGAYLAACDTPGESQLIAQGLWVKAVVLFESGDLGQAAELARRSIDLTWQRQDPLGTALGVEVTAWLRAARGDAATAAVLIGALDRIWAWAGSPLLGYQHLLRHHEACTERLEQALDAASLRHALHRGQRLDLAETAQLALTGQQESALDHERDAERPGRLTRREREVAELVAKGFSNRGIAAELFISPRTVEGHVEHILTKLGLASRVQIANWFENR
jgi:predicted ATPase/DNA-binding NarL/FixJ family response regulator